MPPPEALSPLSAAGVRSRRQAVAPFSAVAITCARLSSVKTRPPATTGSAVMR